ncbi:hypothetical protein Ancab_035023 [Ancistrocladus abbreviatus]
MPVKIVDANLSNFDVVFESFRGEAPNYKTNLILFLADKDPSTSLSGALVLRQCRINVSVTPQTPASRGKGFSLGVSCNGRNNFSAE